jgi:hypothetical protein
LDNFISAKLGLSNMARNAGNIPTIKRVIIEYNRLVRSKVTRLKVRAIRDPFILTMFSVLCEVSIEGEYRLRRKCMPIEQRSIDGAVTVLSQLIRDSHGRGGN